MAQFSFKRHHDANILNDKHVVCTVKCWRHGCNDVVFNVKLGHAALILNRLLRLCLCLCLCSEFAKSLISPENSNLPHIQWWHQKNFRRGHRGAKCVSDGQKSKTIAENSWFLQFFPSYGGKWGTDRASDERVKFLHAPCPPPAWCRHCTYHTPRSRGSNQTDKKKKKKKTV